MTPTYEGVTRWPLYKAPATKEELSVVKDVKVRVWILRNYHAVAHIDNVINVYVCSDEIPKKNIDDFNELNYYMLKLSSSPYKTEKSLETIIRKTEKRKKINRI